MRIKGGCETMDPRLDRVSQFDERSRGFAAVDLVGDRPPRSYTWRVGVNLDQGREGACVGFAVSHEAAARPKAVRGVTDDTARLVYKRAQQIDAWPGDDYSGTSVLAGIKAGQERGFYGEYRWAFGEDDLARTVGNLGPAVLGINWYEGMFRPDAYGYIHPTGAVSGGHAILCYGLNVRGGYYKLWNSWGADWGVGGTCYILREDMALLLSQGGEACIPIQRYVPKEVI